MTKTFNSKEKEKTTSGPIQQTGPVTPTGKPFTDRDSGWKKALKK